MKAIYYSNSGKEILTEELGFAEPAYDLYHVPNAHYVRYLDPINKVFFRDTLNLRSERFLKAGKQWTIK